MLELPCAGTGNALTRGRLRLRRPDPLPQAWLLPLRRQYIPDPSAVWRYASAHVQLFMDAISFGNSLGPEEAYQFARGREVISSTGQRARLSRPLDFLVVADHAENMGSMGEIKAGNPALMQDPELKRWNQMLAAGGEQAMNVYYEIMAGVGGAGKTLPADAIARRNYPVGHGKRSSGCRGKQRPRQLHRVDRL